MVDPLGRWGAGAACRRHNVTCEERTSGSLVVKGTLAMLLNSDADQTERQIVSAAEAAERLASHSSVETVSVHGFHPSKTRLRGQLLRFKMSVSRAHVWTGSAVQGFSAADNPNIIMRRRRRSHGLSPNLVSKEVRSERVRKPLPSGAQV